MIGYEGRIGVLRRQKEEGSMKKYSIRILFAMLLMCFLSVGGMKVYADPSYSGEDQYGLKYSFDPVNKVLSIKIRTNGTSVMQGEKKEDYAWDEYRDRIESVYIYDNVTKLGAYAFADCPNLDKVVFVGNSLTDIKEGCFSGCPNLGETNSDFKLPSSVSVIGSGAFASAGFQTFTWPALAKSRIMPRTFENCPYLVSVIFPTGFAVITSNAAIEDEALKGCSSLISFTVPS